MAEVKFGRYVLLGRVGRGGMGEVFAGRIDGVAGFSKRVAIKRILPDFARQPRFREMFTSEARLAAVLEHVHVVQVHELFDDGDFLGLAMEYADGGSLRTLLKASASKGMPLPWAVVAKIGIDACAALSYAHHLADLQGNPLHIVHRDVSLENVLFTRSGGVKLTDFGIARARGHLDRGLADEVAGKPEYMPREQFLGLACDGRTDVFALGAVLYELLCGTAAFPQGHERALALGTVRPPLAQARPGLPAALCTAIERALEEDLEARPTALDLGEALAQAMSDAGVTATMTELARTVEAVVPPAVLQPIDASAVSGSGLRPVRPRSASLRSHVRPLLGRAAELAALSTQLSGNGAVVTVAGPPGIGKTHLCAHFLESDEAHGRWPTRWAVRLSTARTLDDLYRAVGEALGVRLGGRGATLGGELRITEALKSAGPALLTLDGFEHLVGPGAKVLEAWSSAAPQVALLVTSREPLGLNWERVLHVGPLALPVAGQPAADSPAVQLFVARARAERPAFAPTAAELERLAGLVRELGGVPLAIELAAAHAARAPASETPSPGGTHRTLDDVVEWSMAQLDEAERTTLNRCSVFAGTFSRQAAEAVALRPEVGAQLDRLVERSLVRLDEPQSPFGPRYALLRVVRARAAAELSRSGEEAATQARHAAWFLREGGTWAAGAYGPLRAQLREAIAADFANVLEVHRNALEALPLTAVEASQALAAVLILDPVLALQGPPALHLSLLDTALDAAAVGVHPPLLVRGLWARGLLRRDLGRLDEADADLSRALAVALPSGDAWLEGVSRAWRGGLWVEQGRHESARAELKRAVELLEGTADRRALGLALSSLTLSALEAGELDEARRQYEYTARVLAELGDTRLEAIALGHLANLHLEEGRPAEAADCHRRAVAALEAVHDRRHAGIFTGYLGLDALFADEFEAALTHHDQALQLLAAVGDRRYHALFTASRGAVLALLGRLPEARQALLSAATALAEQGETVFGVAVRLYQAVLEVQVAGMADSAQGLTPLVEERLAEARGPTAAADNDVRFGRKLLERVWARAFA